MKHGLDILFDNKKSNILFVEKFKMFDTLEKVCIPMDEIFVIIIIQQAFEHDKEYNAISPNLFILWNFYLFKIYYQC